MKYTLVCAYTTYTEHTIELPDNKTWDDVASYSVKWDTLYLVMKDETEYRTIDLEYVEAETDYKRPDSTEIRLYDEETDGPNWEGEPVDSTD